MEGANKVMMDAFSRPSEDKDLVEEALNNIWTSSGARQTDLLVNFLAVLF